MPGQIIFPVILLVLEVLSKLREDERSKCLLDPSDMCMLLTGYSINQKMHPGTLTIGIEP